MELQVIGTGSSGNCYLLKAGEKRGQSLLLDAGLAADRIVREAKSWNIAGCLITHEHGDHIKGAEGLARKYGVKVYATKGTIEANGGDSLTVLNAVETLRTFEVGDFTALPFETQHDAKEPCGWLVRFNPTGETVLYATDTYYLKRTFPGVHYWIVECNYIDEILNEQQDSGELPEQLRGRLIKSHMSLRRLCDALKANDLSKTRAIVLIHLSDERSDERRMVETINRQTQKDVWAAEAGKTYILQLTPF